VVLNSIPMLLWIGAVVAASWLAPRRTQGSVVALLTGLFLALQAPLALGLLLLMAVVSHGVVRHRRRWPAAPSAAVAMVLLLLLAFKFAGRPGAGPGRAAVPLGLSYFALRTVHYCLEGWRGALPDHGFLDYLRYQMFLPTLMAGPINRFPEFQQSSRRRRWDPMAFSLGCERILYGYVKIVVLANYLVSTRFVVVLAHMPTASPLRAWLDCLRYGLNLYGQFSGYSDVAIGFALLVGIRVGENFDYPFLARNINEFWNRWHISLTSWCRDYVYMPVLAVSRQPVFAILAAMLTLGLWHELSPRYLVWALYHGGGIALWHGWRRLKGDWIMPGGPRVGRAVTALAVLLTLNFVILSFAITKEPDLRGALAVYATLLGRGQP